MPHLALFSAALFRHYLLLRVSCSRMLSHGRGKGQAWATGEYHLVGECLCRAAATKAMQRFALALFHSTRPRPCVSSLLLLTATHVPAWCQYCGSLKPKHTAAVDFIGCCRMENAHRPASGEAVRVGTELVLPAVEEGREGSTTCVNAPTRIWTPSHYQGGFSAERRALRDYHDQLLAAKPGPVY